MLDQCRQVCVVGAGTMGSGIAAHLANIGFEVTLLDQDQSTVQAKFDAAKSARPPHFYIPETAGLVRLGNIQDNLDWVGQADWVCEAVVENLEVKKALFSQLEPFIRPDALVSTNTSGLQISLLTDGRSESFKRRFIGTHFFNPPRYLKLLELIPTSETDPSTVQTAVQFLESRAARRVVVAKDTPGFIANRYGMWSMFFATHMAEKLGLTVEEVDAITGPLIGRPKSGSFRLNDLVGLDIMQDIAQNLIARCPDDPGTKWLSNPASLDYLLQQGWIGNKTGQGYYRRESGQFLSFDLNARGYREAQTPDLPSIGDLMRKPLDERLRDGLDLRDKVGEYLREYLVPTLRYAESIRSEVCHNVQDFDNVMEWGFGWEAGPFRMIEMIGHERLGIAQPKAYYNGIDVLDSFGDYTQPVLNPDFWDFKDFPLAHQGQNLNIRDLGDDVSAITLTTKMGVVTPGFVDELTDILVNTPPKKLVIGSEAKAFSVGFDLKFFVQAAADQNWGAIEQAIEKFEALHLLLHAIPSVAAVHGYCLGGGYEVAAGCQMIVASAESQIGLPEAKVGLIPGGAGTALMRLRSQHDAKSMAATVETIVLGTVSSNADEARKIGYLRRQDVTSYHPDRLVAEAKGQVLKLEVKPQNEWLTVSGPFRGMADQLLSELKAKGEITDHDVFIGDRIKHVFNAATSWDDAIQRERDAFLTLVQEGLTQARMKHMLETGKPLRN